jgi:small nuclear ribonucleoprotein E
MQISHSSQQKLVNDVRTLGGLKVGKCRCVDGWSCTVWLFGRHLVSYSLRLGGMGAYRFCFFSIQKTAHTMTTKVQKVMVQPINLIFRYLQSKARVQIWLYEQLNMRIEGRIIVSCVVTAGIVFSLFQQQTPLIQDVWTKRRWVSGLMALLIPLLLGGAPLRFSSMLVWDEELKSFRALFICFSGVPAGALH